MAQTFNLPDAGEGLTEAEIVSWKVSPGDTVAINDVLVEIETAKSLVELPSPWAGTVGELLVAEGVTVEVGTPIITVLETGETAAAPAPAAPAAAGHDDPTPPDVGPQAAPGPLVGSGPRADAVKRRARHTPTRPQASGAGRSSQTGTATQKSAAAPQEPDRTPAVTPQPEPSPRPQAAPTPPAPAPTAPAPAPAAPSRPAGNPIERLVQRVLAKPPVRKAAKDLGIDLADVTASGAGGEVTREDLISYAEQVARNQARAPQFWNAGAKHGLIEKVPVRGVRKATAAAMVQSAFSAPHVSIFVDVDATRTMEFVQRLKASRDFEGIKVSPLLILAKAVIWAAARNPQVNASWVPGDAGDEIHIKHFMNLGIAAATPRGLMVPNIKNAQDLTLKELAVALGDLAGTARAGKTKPADMQGGTLSITNIGVLGIDIGTPIINPGEVAIVAFGTIRQKPWVVSGEVIARWITTLGGSFDHRVVDGDLSARFMADVAAIMEEPALLLE
ncbi:dihydrolipoamide acetyltransferase family protein [Tersicoccus sp. Bi-70]|uniref:dihydrolipoamide acetyltransferase family protein n=1 Tax=Tersicoccus sp. Bi-70 TaxID=1897634 RepID=UPI0009760AA1|nr:dihydrolipoamide acetyltransferase family protein [Tersicoccus sp. Bi-70]OMH34314.1 branched-chain alpha-keto acid dehydrogenase subunit E2 [Tersicoccus sp. Bi-70]